MNNYIKSFKNLNIEKIFYMFLCLTGAIDLINGFTISIFGSSTITVGKIARLILLTIVLILIIKSKNKIDKSMFFIIIAYFTLDNMVTFLNHRSVLVLVNDMVNVSKLFLVIGIIVAGRSLIAENKLTKRELDKIISINLMVISVSLLICKVFNLGESAYLNDVGFKGYFYSNNELSIVLSLFYIYCCDKIYNNIVKKYKLPKEYVINTLLVMVSLALIGAKTSYLVIIVTVIIYVSLIFKRNTIKKNMKIALGIIICILVMSGGFFIFFRQEVLDVFYKQAYYFKNRSILNFILSDRNLYWEQIRDSYIIGKQNILTMLFGFRGKVVDNLTFVNIEMDAHVLYLNYGLVGFFFIFAFFMKIYINSSKKLILLYPFFIYLLFSVTAGHVLFGAFAGTFLAIHCMSMMRD